LWAGELAAGSPHPGRGVSEGLWGDWSGPLGPLDALRALTPCIFIYVKHNSHVTDVCI